MDYKGLLYRKEKCKNNYLLFRFTVVVHEFAMKFKQQIFTNVSFLNDNNYIKYRD